jgi:hypothetical protein
MRLSPRLLGLSLMCAPALCLAAVATPGSGEPVVRPVQPQVKPSDQVKPTTLAPSSPRPQTVSPRPTPRPVFAPRPVFVPHPVVAPRAPALAPATRRSGIASGSGLTSGVLGGPAGPNAQKAGVVQGTGMKHRH